MSRKEPVPELILPDERSLPAALSSGVVSGLASVGVSQVTGLMARPVVGVVRVLIQETRRAQHRMLLQNLHFSAAAFIHAPVVAAYQEWAVGVHQIRALGLPKEAEAHALQDLERRRNQWLSFQLI